MANFDPKLLAPASTVAAFSKDAGRRTTKQVAIANIDRMISQAKDPAVEGKRNFTTDKDMTKFSIRVSNVPLELAVFVDGKPATTREASVPTKSFPDALGYFKAEIEAGRYDEQLTALDGKRDARVAKLQSTRAANKEKKVEKPAG